MSAPTLNEQLWVSVLESAAPLKIDPSCQLFLQAWITNGVERMHNENRIAPENVATAKDNLKTFIELMKAEPLAHGTERLDNKCFHAALHKLERRSFITVYSLWPFWPHAVSG
jgi:thymidylate kinase